MEVKAAITKNSQEFRNLSNKEIETLQACSLARSYKKGQVLFNPGDDRNYFFLLVSGTIRIEKVDSTGTFFYLHFIKDEYLFPRIGLFQDNTYTYSALAHTDIDIVAIPVKVFEDILRENSPQLVQWIGYQSDIIKRNMVKIQKGAMNNANQRVITTLAIIFKELGESNSAQGTVTVHCPMTINDISRSSATTRETTSSIIKKLVKLKKISYKYKQLTFLDVDFFKAVLND